MGRYHVTAHQPSQYRWFLRLDYPNADDVRLFEAAKRAGAIPRDAMIGGDIGIRGPPVSVPAVLKAAFKLQDWTLGCIAVDDDEIQEIARLVNDRREVETSSGARRRPRAGGADDAPELSLRRAVRLARRLSESRSSRSSRSVADSGGLVAYWRRSARKRSSKSARTACGPTTGKPIAE